MKLHQLTWSKARPQHLTDIEILELPIMTARQDM